MKSKKELNNDILKILMKIMKINPELLKYLDEMPMEYKNREGSNSSAKSLANYYNSLKALLSNYRNN